MDKWQKLKDFLTEGKQNISKDVFVSRPSVFEEILDIMEELEKRELSELKENKKPLQAELEEIKAEIGKIKTADGGDFLERPAIDIIYEAQKILDKHISELKGENKKECSTCKSDNSLENCLGCIEYGHWESKGENNAE